MPQVQFPGLETELTNAVRTMVQTSLLLTRIGSRLGGISAGNDCKGGLCVDGEMRGTRQLSKVVSVKRVLVMARSKG